MTRLVKGQWTNGRRSYVTPDGRFYAFYDPESKWSVGRTVDGVNHHIADFRTFNAARRYIGILASAEGVAPVARVQCPSCRGVDQHRQGCGRWVSGIDVIPWLDRHGWWPK